MKFLVVKYGGRDDGEDVLGGPVELENHHVRFSLIYGEASPDSDHSKDPSALQIGEYTLGRARDNTVYKVVAVAEECEFCGNSATHTETFDREVPVCDECGA